MAVSEGVAVGKQLCPALYGSERHVMKMKKKKPAAVMKLVESCTIGWITSLPRAFILCWQIVPTC